MKKYILKSWIPVEIEYREPLTMEEVALELEQAEMLFPENRYEIVEVE